MIESDLCYGFNKTLTKCACCQASTTANHAFSHDGLCRACYLQFKESGLL